MLRYSPIFLIVVFALVNGTSKDKPIKKEKTEEEKHILKPKEEQLQDESDVPQPMEVAQPESQQIKTEPTDETVLDH